MISDLFSLSQATLITIKLALCSLVLGLVIGMIFAAWESSRYKWFASIATTLVTLIRGLPEILVVLSIYFSAPYVLILLSDGFTIPLYFTSIHVQMNIQSFDVSPFGCGVVALSLLYAAYSSQTLRGALKSVPHGQKESALALGLPVITIYRRIILPQMWRHALPGLGNQWLVLLKDTALVSLIAVNDIMMQTKSIITRTNDPVGPFNGYLIAAAIYLIITLISQYILKKIEQRVTHFEKVSS